MAAARKLYGWWWRGLADLAAAIGGGLRSFDVTGPAAHAAPWTDRDLVARARTLHPAQRGCADVVLRDYLPVLERRFADLTRKPKFA